MRGKSHAHTHLCYGHTSREIPIPEGAQRCSVHLHCQEVFISLRLSTWYFGWAWPDGKADTFLSLFCLLLRGFNHIIFFYIHSIRLLNVGLLFCALTTHIVKSYMPVTRKVSVHWQPPIATSVRWCPPPNMGKFWWIPASPNDYVQQCLVASIGFHRALAHSTGYQWMLVVYTVYYC